MVIPRPSRGPLKCMRVEAKEQNKEAKKTEVERRRKEERQMTEKFARPLISQKARELKNRTS